MDGEEDGEILLAHAQPHPTSSTRMSTSASSQGMKGGIRIVSPEEEEQEGDDDNDDDDEQNLGDVDGGGGGGSHDDNKNNNPWQSHPHQQQGIRPYDPSAYARYEHQQQQQQQQTQTQYGYGYGRMNHPPSSSTTAGQGKNTTYDHGYASDRR